MDTSNFVIDLLEIINNELDKQHILGFRDCLKSMRYVLNMILPKVKQLEKDKEELIKIIKQILEDIEDQNYIDIKRMCLKVIEKTKEKNELI